MKAPTASEEIEEEIKRVEQELASCQGPEDEKNEILAAITWLRSFKRFILSLEKQVQEQVHRENYYAPRRNLSR